ncbi:MAG: glyoxalase/bleomycin resistance/extradiol dioxygenase family protein [Planctomyces sp.]|nr:glyoxalase/bleomycin resistance/extradiol dioxygenase family protein [Planctomyces sp.]
MSHPQIVQPYLYFNGRCAEAMERYQQVLGAVVEFSMTFREAPQPHPPEFLPADWDDKIMHASVRIGSSRLMMSDGMCADAQKFDGFAMAATAPTTADADRLFAELADGGAVTMPLETTFFSPRFGMLIDRFGVHWMVVVEQQQS